MHLTNTASGLEAQIKAEAYRLGFCLCGITSTEPPAGYAKFEDWLAHGYQAGMKYMSSEFHRKTRKDPRLLMPSTQSIVCLAYPYALPSLALLDQKDAFLVVGYVGERDYHLVLPEKLKQLITQIETICGSKVEHQIFCDSGPILERELAMRAGLGWIGKNSCLISPAEGSAFLLSEVLLALPLTPDAPFSVDRCGSCQRCISACPTHCINPDRTIDANRCLSYHTIENKGEIPQEIAERTPPWLFGCDICQMVCPWNQHITRCTTTEPYTPADMIEWLGMDAVTFEDRYKGSAILRAKYSGWMRNTLINLASLDRTISEPILRSYLNRQTDPQLHELICTLLENKKNDRD